MDTQSSRFFSDLKSDLTAYAELKIEFLKLSTYERVGKVISILSYGLILLFLAFFALLFVFLSVGFFLGDLFGSQGLGFVSVAVLYLVSIFVIVLNKKRICEKVLNEVIETLTMNEEKNNVIESEEQATNTAGEADF